MVIEKSCGAVVYTIENGEIKYLIIRSLEGIYGFPKGHMEAKETMLETALREVKEETNIDITIDNDFVVTDEYSIPSKKDTIKN